MSDTEEYDDETAVEAFIQRYWTHYMTDFEQRCYYIGMRRFKAERSGNSSFKKMVKREWASGATDEIRATLSQGFLTFSNNTEDRIRREIREGAIRLNRCPNCKRLARTPRAQQCFWCNFDWHDQ